MCAGYAGPTVPGLGRRPLRRVASKSGDEQVPLEAVPAMSQNASLGPMLPFNFANFGFSAPP